MKLTVAGVEHRIDFRHLRYDEPLDFGFPTRTIGETACRIDHQPGGFLWHGIAHCSEFDNYSKRKGRKFAFAKMLKRMEFPREMRTRFWDAYFNQLPKDRRTS